MNIIIEKVKKTHITDLVTLFKENYGSYHYSAFSSEKSLLKLFSNNLKGWVGLENDKVVAFAGLYDTVQDDYHLIKLAHLLVDKKYRGYLIGSRLEKERNDYYSKFQHALVVASCVDIPPQSVQLKLKYGFYFLGMKTNYRCSNLVGDNSIILGKYSGINHKEVKLEMPSLSTRDFIIQICKNSNYVYKFNDSNNYKYDMKFEYDIDQINSRIVGYISFNENGIPLIELIRLFDILNMRYMSIKINTRILGFGQLDNLLCNNGYIPTVYIPYYGKHFDLLEYQKLNIEDYKIYKKIFEEYIRK